MFRANIVILILSVVACAVACQQPSVWQDYTSPNRDFRVQFPDKPTETIRTSPLSNGDVKYPKVVWTGDGVTLDMSYSEIPDLRPLDPQEAKEYYEFLRDQTVRMNQSQLTGSSEVTVDGKLGQDFTEVRPGGKVTRYRLFLLGTRLLSLRGEQDVGVRPATETNSIVEKFMASLRFQ